MSQHPIHQINDDVHQRVRLGILASVHGMAKADFTYLKSTLELTDGNLGRHLEALEQAGLIALSRTTGSGRPRTWVKITAKGRKALRDEVRALQQLLGPVTALSEQSDSELNKMSSNPRPEPQVRA